MCFLALRCIKLVDLANELNTMVSWLMYVACAGSSIHVITLTQLCGLCLLDGGCSMVAREPIIAKPSTAERERKLGRILED